MPTYQYICTACGHEFERFESMTAKPNKTCPKCKKKKGERQISGGAGFIFKGSGFYTTDYRKSSYDEAAKKDAGESKPSGDKKASGDTKKSGGKSSGSSSASSDKGASKSKGSSGASGASNSSSTSKDK